MGTEQSQLEASQPVREAVNDRGLFTVGWFGVREKHRSRLKIYDRLRTSEQAVSRCGFKFGDESESVTHSIQHFGSFFKLRFDTAGHFKEQ